MSHTAVEFFSKQGYRLTSPMGWRPCPMDRCKPQPWSKCPVCKGTGRNYHGGVDLATGRCGDPVLTPWPGICTEAAWYTGWGNTFAMDIGPGSGWMMLTAHHQGLWVPRGKALRKGDQVAVNGTTGNSTGCHVHLEIRKNDGSRIGSRDRLDPALFRLTPVEPSSRYKPGDWINTTAIVNLRRDPGTATAVIMVVIAGTVGQILAHGDNGRHVNGYHWWHVDLESGRIGWMAEEFLVDAEAPKEPKPMPEPPVIDMPSGEGSTKPPELPPDTRPRRKPEQGMGDLRVAEAKMTQQEDEN